MLHRQKICVRALSLIHLVSSYVISPLRVQCILHQVHEPWCSSFLVTLLLQWDCNARYTECMDHGAARFWLRHCCNGTAMHTTTNVWII